MTGVPAPGVAADDFQADPECECFYRRNGYLLLDGQAAACFYAFDLLHLIAPRLN